MKWPKERKRACFLPFLYLARESSKKDLQIPRLTTDLQSKRPPIPWIVNNCNRHLPTSPTHLINHLLRGLIIMECERKHELSRIKRKMRGWSGGEIVGGTGVTVKDVERKWWNFVSFSYIFISLSLFSSLNNSCLFYWISIFFNLHPNSTGKSFY